MTDTTRGTLGAEGTAASAGLRVRLVTINQLVGYNMAWYRKAADLTQEELGQRLGGWSKVAVSAAERSWDGKRIRQFNADELVNIARAIGIPVSALFLPPEDAGTALTYELEGSSKVLQRISLTELLPYFLTSLDDQTPVMAAFRIRLMGLGASDLVEIDRASTILADARSRAESLERDAQMRHSVAMGSLMAKRDEILRSIDDLRTFERGYRSRLLDFMESQISDLRSKEDDRKFVLKKGSTGKYHFNLVAANGQVVATSEAFEQKQSALDAIESVKSSATGAAISDQTTE